MQATPHRVITWRTTKTSSGYAFRVVSFDHGTETLTHATGTLPTRARAVTKAKAWVRYLKAQQARQGRQ